MIPADEYRRIAIVGFLASLILSTLTSVGILLGALSPVWLVSGVPALMLVFLGYLTYREVALTREQRRGEAQGSRRPSASAT